MYNAKSRVSHLHIMLQGTLCKKPSCEIVAGAYNAGTPPLSLFLPAHHQAVSSNLADFAFTLRRLLNQVLPVAFITICSTVYSVESYIKSLCKTQPLVIRLANFDCKVTFFTVTNIDGSSILYLTFTNISSYGSSASVDFLQ